MQPVKMLISVALCALLWNASQVVAPSWYSSAIQPSPSLQATPSGMFFCNLMPCHLSAVYLQIDACVAIMYVNIKDMQIFGILNKSDK